jgi:hypothetical protein
MYPSVQSNDARVADAERFLSDVEDVADRYRPGDPPPRFDRIDGPDRTGTAYAVVDATGRFIDLGLDPGWWAALGPGRVATGITEALEAARMKASLVWLVLRRHGVRPPPPPVDRLPPLPLPGDDDFVSAVRNRIEDAYQLADDTRRRLRDANSARVVAGPRGLVRLHVRGRRIERIEVEQYNLTADDTDRLVADARQALNELAGPRGTC